MLNVKNCLGSGANTGFGDCPVELNNIVSYILTPPKFKIPAVSLLTKEATLLFFKTATLAGKATRVYPVNNIGGLDGNIEDPVTETLGYGAIKTLRDGNYNLNFRLEEGGLCLSNALRKFNANKPEVLFIDANGLLIGQKVGEDLGSIPLVNFYQKGASLNDGAGATSGYITNMVFQPKYLNENIGFQDGGNSLFWDLQGLQDVTLATTTGNAEPILKIVASTGCNGESLFEQFPTQFANIANWVLTNTATGAPITITSIAIVGKVATITASTVDTDYPTGGGSISLSFASPSVLDLAGVSGFESNVLVIPTA